MFEKDLSADIASIVDLINIKNLPETISDYLHDNGKTKCNNLRKFYSLMLDCFGEDIKASYLNRILKYLSSDKSSEIYLLDDINDCIFDKELMLFTSELVKLINSTENYQELYEALNKKIDFIFYDTEEYRKIIKLYSVTNYEEFIFWLLKHAFSRYKLSLPGIVARSLYIQSQTMIANSSARNRLLNASSILGNDDATINLYCTLLPFDVNAATKVLLRSKENEMVLWSIAFNLEGRKINDDVLQEIKSKYKYIIDEPDDFVSKITETERARKELNGTDLLLAYKIYNYCYKKYRFTKAGNSLGKLLIFDFVSYNNDREETIKIAKQILKEEIKVGNINAITNMAVYLYLNTTDPEYDYEQVKKWFITSASFGDREGVYFSAEIFFNEGDYEKAFQYLDYAKFYKEGRTYKLLGQYYELKNDIVNAQENYKQAILNKEYNAAYNLAVLYLNIKTNDEKEKVLYRNMSNDYLNRYYDLFSDEIKEKAKILIDKKF